MREARAEGEERDEADVAGGGYEGVALAIMAAISRGAESTMILNIRNGEALAGLPADAVVEIPCTVDRRGPRAAALPPVEGHQLGTMQQVKAVEQAVIEAATTGSADAALRAFALHPLVDSVSTARRLLAGYRAASPEVDALLS
jgi:6-phospho-beta-glucosidase